MTPERQQVLADFVLEQWLPRHRMVRNWSATGLVLCGVVAGILISVRLDGATGSEDVLVPAAIAAGLAVVLGITLLYALAEIRGLRRHPLIAALRASPPRIARVEPLTIQSDDGVVPALTFHVIGGGVHTIVMSEATRDELIAWLGAP